MKKYKNKVEENDELRLRTIKDLKFIRYHLWAQLTREQIIYLIKKLSYEI